MWQKPSNDGPFFDLNGHDLVANVSGPRMSGAEGQSRTGTGSPPPVFASGAIGLI